MTPDKSAVYDFWNAASCGENLYLDKTDKRGYERQAEIRYKLEPYILSFADFASSRGKTVLEIGVGLGADHQKFAEAGAILTGVDITERAVEHVRQRFELFGLSSVLQVADAENLPFENKSFDLVYSWGVLHHSPDTQRAITEVLRVLKPGGTAKIMVYHKYSMVGYMLWLRYALLGLRPWMSLRTIYGRYLESPGTKAYSVTDARQLFQQYRSVAIETVLTHGDLLESDAGQRHRGPLLSIAREFWPRPLIRRFFGGSGLFMLITAMK